MRKPILATIALAAVATVAAMTAMPYLDVQTRAAQAAQFTSEQRGAFAQAPAVLPLMSRPKPAVPATETPAAPAKPDAKRAVKPAAKQPASAPKRNAAKPSSRDAEAQRILRGLIRKHPILKGTTVTFGRTRSGAQAEAFYKSGRIVVSPSHRASINTILTHEVWHVIDWRANGRIDWGERIPPRYDRSY